MNHNPERTIDNHPTLRIFFFVKSILKEVKKFAISR